MSKLISIVTPCFNEVENVEPLHTAVDRIMAEYPQYTYEHIFIDNCSTDGTVEILRRMAANNRRVKVILNSRNFGSICSPVYAYLLAKGDAVITLAADFQEPPALIPVFIAKWEAGNKVVIGVKVNSQESKIKFMVRKLGYHFINKISDRGIIENFAGFGIYDKQVVDSLRGMCDSYPSFRNMVAEVGFAPVKVPFVQPKRRSGITKHRIYNLFDFAMQSLVTSSKLPLRLATWAGVLVSGISFLVGIGYLVYKLLHWDTFSAGMAPVIIGLAFLGGVILLFLGIIGEYVGAIYTQVLKRPLVIEKERINFDK